MSAEQSMDQVRAKRPKGITVLVLVFYGAAALVVISALATGEQNIPSDISALITLYLLVLAWGLWKLYRWAWYSTLIMFVLSMIYLLSNGQRSGEPLFGIAVGVPIGCILLTLAYLLSTKVRQVYLHNGWMPAPDQTHAETATEEQAQP